VPLVVRSGRTVEGKVGVNVVTTAMVSPSASVVVYVKGVGPPGTPVLLEGCPTGPCWICAVVLVVIVIMVGAVVGTTVVLVVEATTVNL
jgi:hypothetical protein